MKYQYVISKDKESDIIQVIARFADGVPELYKNEKWQVNGFLISMLHDGRLQNVTEAEALKLIEERKFRQLQVT